MRTGRTISDSLAGISAPSSRASLPRDLEGIAGVAIGDISGGWQGSPTRRKNDGSRTDFNRSSGCAATKGTFTQRRTSFFERSRR